MITAQKYFLRYAFPCAYALVEQKRMSKEDYLLLEQAALTNKEVSFEQLENFFPVAFKRIKEIAKKQDKNYHSLEIIKEYFQKEHNNFIDNKDGTYAKLPETFCDFCKVKVVEVQDIKTINNELLLQINEHTWRKAPFIKKEEINIGDKVTIHHAYAIELVK